MFKYFIETLLSYCGKWPEPRPVLVMDNASFHHPERIQQICDNAGVVALSATYSPDLDPIEEFFGELKICIRQVWDEYIGFVRGWLPDLL